MPQCAVVNCNNTHRKTKGGSVRYHRFPGDAETRARWIQACGRHVQNCATARICSRHFSDFSYERDVQHELLGLPTRCRLKKGSVPDKNLPPELQEEHPPVDSAIAVLLAVGLVPNVQVAGRKSGGLPQDLNKMHVMEDVREGCDAQPSSPGHADQRPELEVESCTENGLTQELNENVASNAGDSDSSDQKNCLDVPKPNGKIKDENEHDLYENQENTSTSEQVSATVSQYKRDSENEAANEDSGSNDSSTGKRKSDGMEPAAKKFKSDMEQSFQIRDKILTEYINNANCSTLEQIQSQTEQIIAEIRTLTELAKEKEREWNNIIHLKKIKEELLLRIQRQKQIILISSDNCDNSEFANILENQAEERSPQNSTNKQSLLKQKVGHAGRNQEKLNDVIRHRQILPKTLPNNTFDINGQGNDFRQVRQRNVVDVQSIIADFRQRHPENVPRRGRRIRSGTNSHGDGVNSKVTSTGILNFSSIALGSGAQVRQNLSEMNSSELGLLLSSMENGGRQDNFRSHLADINNANPQDITSFKDMLVQFAKLSQTEKQDLMQNKVKPPPPYPEVTVHPVTTASPQPTSSLLHGILTKAQTKSESKSTFSPTLARLLTAPERAAASVSQAASPPSSSLMHAANVSITEILSSSKARNEITITPVGGHYEVSPKPKSNTQVDDEEAEDSADRLVIDESVELVDGRSRNDNSSDNDEVPQCQGCNQKPAQFVCAGCGNQWYCSRECQVSAWDEHSEVCSG